MSLEDYSKAVKEHAMFYLKYYDKEDVKKFLGSSETKEFIESRYKQDTEYMKKGKKQTVWEGCISSAGYCLQMMFE